MVWDAAADAASLTISFQPAWWVRRQPWCSRESMPACWLQKGEVPTVDFKRLETGMIVFPVGF